MGPIVVLKPGESAYFSTLGAGRNRWGDYSAAVVDPEDDLAFWTIQEYAVSRNVWGTWWGRLSSCGDGVVQPGEACDDGAANGTTCCSTTCRLPDTDGDGVCDRLDPCPHLANTTPQPLVRAPRVTLHYRPNSPGGQDDGLRVANSVFTTPASFDLDSIQTLHVRLDNAGSSRTLFEAELAAGGLWLQPNAGTRRWIYLNHTQQPTMGIRKAKVAEAPAGSGSYRLDVVGRETTINSPAAPLTPPGDAVRVVLEIEAGGVGECFAATLSNCKRAGPHSQRCGP